ncbi:MAG: sulfatase-like hydrolase/transferase [Desulfovibrionaceae bacterium]|nr:sulfatase-like hydrolase/transferase [Desulfovibrionaceae bacterium]
MSQKVSSTLKNWTGFFGGEPFPKYRSPFCSYLLCLGFVLLLLFLFRLAFLAFIADSLAGVSPQDILKALYIGFRFDARIAAGITLPIGILLTIPCFKRWLMAHLGLISGFYFFLFLLLILIYMGDFGHYLYLKTRLNAYVLDLLKDFQVAVDMVWQSYPVIPLALALVFSALMCALAIQRILRRMRPTRTNAPRAALTWFAGLLIFALAAYGQISSNFFPLRWSNAYFSPNMTLAALALNPVQNLYDTFKSAQGGGFDLEATRKHYPLMSKLLNIDNPDADSLNYARHTPEKRPAPGEQHPNIVIIVMESLSFPKTSFAPGPLDPTPFLRELAEESKLYTKFFAPTRTTARAIFTTFTGIPDINQEGNTSSRNPFVVDQRVVLNEFAGYRKMYMLGANTSWANIRGILATNVDDLEIMEEGAWKAPNMDVWGVSDYDLLQEAQNIFESSPRPFFAFVQLASFHRPYTIPANALEGGFEILPINEEARVNYGFISEEEYNSLRFSDFAVQEFFRMAKQSNYYNNTIFFIFGDHGLSDRGANMPAPYWAADLHSYHVPLLIHAPGRVAPGVEETPCSQLDIMPTAAALAGIEFNNYTLGRDLFDSRFDNSRFAFVSGPGTTPTRLIEGEYCYFDNRQGQQVLYDLREDKVVNRAGEHPETFARLKNLATAMQESSRYILYNNQKKLQPETQSDK